MTTLQLLQRNELDHSPSILNQGIVASIIIAAFSVAFYRTAWVTEDAFITFRVVDNVLNGYGPVWHVGERVQLYTHPLWFALLVGVVGIFGSPYVGALALSYGMLLGMLTLVWQMVREKSWVTLVPVVSLLWSQAFIDYSSSGLENPLTHVLIAGFLWVWVNKPRRKTLILSLITSGLFLSRPDAIVLVAPAMAWHLVREGEWKDGLLGALPAMAWVVFSMFYYGSPVPNTALAKVGNGLTLHTHVMQAFYYFKWTFTHDPITMIIMVLGLVCGLLEERLRPLAVGFFVFFLYLFYVGADYMGGRFFSAPVFFAALMVALYAGKRVTWLLFAVLILTLKYLAFSLFASINFDSHIFEHGISNERGVYYHNTGLLPVIYMHSGNWKTYPWFKVGKLPPGLYSRCYLGMAGYAAGPHVRFIDPLALNDPFLARLPAGFSRVGHYERALPDGFLDSALTGENRVVDPALHALYADVILATQAPLLSFERLHAIWRLNTGFHRHAARDFNRYATKSLPGTPVETHTACFSYGDPSRSKRIALWKIDGPPAAAKPP